MDLQRNAFSSSFASAKPSPMAATSILGIDGKKTAESLNQWQKSEIQRITAEKDQHLERLRLLRCIEDMKEAWGDEDCEFDVLAEQKNTCSRLHSLADCLKNKKCIFFDDDGDPAELPLDAMPSNVQTFVVSHPWHSLVGSVDGDVRLPYDECAFEFMLGGRCVIALCVQGGGSIDSMVFYQAKNGDWVTLGAMTGTTWEKRVRACCIVLEAEVAEHEVVCAPIALNEKRIRNGKTPMFNHRIINLAKRHRAASSAGHETGHKKRLHFCRGHWRHFEKSKTWIKWCLKGDADLGFVTKEYRL